MHRDRDTASSVRVLELDMRALLHNDHPTQALEGADKLPTGDAREWWHRATVLQQGSGYAKARAALAENGERSVGETHPCRGGANRRYGRMCLENKDCRATPNSAFCTSRL